jgi:hypothetical protein
MNPDMSMEVAALCRTSFQQGFTQSQPRNSWGPENDFQVHQQTKRMNDSTYVQMYHWVVPVSQQCD